MVKTNRKKLKIKLSSDDHGISLRVCPYSLK